MTEDEKDTVLNELYWKTTPMGEFCTSFRQIEIDAGLSRKVVRDSCRALRKDGLAEFYRGLMTEECDVAGSGYCITEAGKKLWDSKFAKGMVS